MRSPAFILLIVALAVFTAETAAAWLLLYIPHLSEINNALLDGVLAALLAAPALYFLLFRPMAAHVRARARMEAILLKNREEQFKKIIHSSLDGFWLVDLSGQFLDVNEAFCQLLGYPREKLLQMRMSEVQDPEAAFEHWLLQPVERHRLETRLRHQDGRWIAVEISINHSHEQGGHLYGFVHNISRRKQTEEELRLQAQLLNSTSDSVFLLDLQGNFVYMNEAAYKSRGYSQEELMSINLRELNDPSMNALLPGRMKKLMEEGSAFFESIHRKRDGSLMPVEINSRLTESQGRTLALSVIRDITERKRAEAWLRESEARLKELFENLSSAVVAYRVEPDNGQFMLVEFNRAAERLEEISRAEVLGKDVESAFPEMARSGVLNAMQRVFASGVSEHLPSVRYQRGWLIGWREYFIYRLSNQELVTICDDITQKKQAEAQMYQLAHYDPLTNLPNRVLFAERFHQSWEWAQQHAGQLALLFIDLDKFKEVNDNLGHEAGDFLLREVAQRMQNCVRDSDCVSRMGGDEFVILLSSIGGVTEAVLVAEKILYALNQPFPLQGNTAQISGSIGIATYPEHGDTEKILLKHADMAMYQAKEAGRDNVVVYHPDMNPQ